MGYTHYWGFDRSLTEDERAGIEEDVSAIIAHSNVRLAGWDGSGDPVVGGDQCVSLNGRGEYAHESFSFPDDESREGFNFCKTAYKPYDTIVTAILIAAKDRAPGAFGYSSDGQTDDWEEGRALASEATGRSLSIRLDD